MPNESRPTPTALAFVASGLALFTVVALLAGCSDSVWDHPAEGVSVTDWTVAPAASARPPTEVFMPAAFTLSGHVVNESAQAYQQVALDFRAADGNGSNIMIGYLRPGERRPFAVGVPTGEGWKLHGAFDVIAQMP